jgi:hypothetical protein
MKTLRETKKILGLANESYLRKLILEGKIRAEKHGRDLFVTSEEINRIISLRKGNFYRW